MKEIPEGILEEIYDGSRGKSLKDSRQKIQEFR